jgi:hypothetical protein
MAKYTVVTAITGGRDVLKKQPEQDGVRYICFTDDMKIRSMGWELLPACDKFIPYLNAKIHKILIHKYIDSEYTLWIDGSVLINKSVEKMTDTFLKDNDIAVYNHRSWSVDDKVGTIEDEIAECCEKRKDDPKRIHEQYKNNVYPKRVPPVCTIIFRRNNMQMERLNEKWWSEICRYSIRDQLSFPYVFQDYYEIGGQIKEDFEIIAHEVC